MDNAAPTGMRNGGGGAEVAKVGSGRVLGGGGIASAALKNPLEPGEPCTVPLLARADRGACIPASMAPIRDLAAAALASASSPENKEIPPEEVANGWVVMVVRSVASSSLERLGDTPAGFCSPQGLDCAAEMAVCGGWLLGGWWW